MRPENPHLPTYKLTKPKDKKKYHTFGLFLQRYF